MAPGPACTEHQRNAPNSAAKVTTIHRQQALRRLQYALPLQEWLKREGMNALTRESLRTTRIRTLSFLFATRVKTCTKGIKSWYVVCRRTKVDRN